MVDAIDDQKVLKVVVQFKLFECIWKRYSCSGGLEVVEVIETVIFFEDFQAIKANSIRKALICLFLVSCLAEVNCCT